MKSKLHLFLGVPFRVYNANLLQVKEFLLTFLDLLNKAEPIITDRHANLCILQPDKYSTV